MGGHHWHLVGKSQEMPRKASAPNKELLNPKCKESLRTHTPV